MYPETLKPEENYRYTYLIPDGPARPLSRGFVMRDYSIGLHVQTFFEVNIVLKGSGMHYFEGQRLPARRGGVFIIPPETGHGYVGGKGFDVYHFLISPRFMEKYLEDLQTLPAFFILFRAEPMMRSASAEPLHLTLSEAQFARIESLLREIQALDKPCTPPEALRCNSLSVLLIAALCEIYAENTACAQKIPQYDEAFMNALALIHEHYDEKLSIARLAKTAQLSRSAFIRRFYEVCHTSPAQYLLHRRVEAAAHLLAATGLSVTEVAERTGFYDAPHLSRIFAAEMGIPPGQYRKAHQVQGK